MLQTTCRPFWSAARVRNFVRYIITEQPECFGSERQVQCQMLQHQTRSGCPKHYCGSIICSRSAPFPMQLPAGALSGMTCVTNSNHLEQIALTDRAHNAWITNNTLLHLPNPQVMSTISHSDCELVASAEVAGNWKLVVACR